ncbi:hypothetical protein CATYP_02890 [Corynebacterium atypicum]|uniref:Uncharacterized protein n=1 Tax=Corynebacterium atypicum TaxID=191610 RepID=A0ABN4DBP3_9CORY|nr:hypothetical protein [Corynebacterium atypicum]AIG63805.1 hypothetical protein CATYP_02890 [Corynebacterium atypicum]
MVDHGDGEVSGGKPADHGGEYATVGESVDADHRRAAGGGVDEVGDVSLSGQRPADLDSVGCQQA